jgi:hypothetical protein
MDFSWVAQDDSNAIQNAIVDAKGDLIGATAADTPARLAVGTNGQVLTADSTAATGLAWTTVSGAPTSLFYAAGKNKIINGDFGVWQRGTSFSITNTIAYTADRFMVQCNSASLAATISQQTFTPGSAPVAGYEGQFFLRVTNPAGATNTEIQQRIEDVRTFAGQTVTLSFWAKASSAVTMANTIIQNFGSGGSGTVSTTGTSQTLTTSWARYSTTINVPSVSGKTIGTSSYLQVYPMYYSSGTIASNVIDIWGVQLEAGSTATDFQTATGTIQGELAACQRYYVRFGGDANFQILGYGNARSTSVFDPIIPLPVSMRVAPTAVDFSTLASVQNFSGSATAISTLSLNVASKTMPSVAVTSSGTPFTANESFYLTANNSTSAYIGFSAEL